MNGTTIYIYYSRDYKLEILYLGSENYREKKLIALPTVIWEPFLRNVTAVDNQMRSYVRLN